MAEQKPRKVYKKILRKRGYNCDGEKRKELTDKQRGKQLFNLGWGRVCMAYAMEGLPKPKQQTWEYLRTKIEPEKGKTYVFKRYTKKGREHHFYVKESKRGKKK